MPDQSPSTQAQPKHVHPDDLFRLQWIQDAQFSPDGTYIVYEQTVSDPGNETEAINDKAEERCALYLLELASQEARQLTNGAKKDTAPRWSPDGRQIAFQSTRGEKAQIYVIAVDGGEARQVTSLKQGVGSGPIWSPDGSQLAFSASPHVEPVDLSKPYRWNRHIYRFDGMGDVHNALQEIFLVPATGGEAQQLTHDNAVASSPQWSPDGNELLYLSSHRADTHIFLPILKIVDRQGTTRDLLAGWGVVSSAAWTVDGTQIVFIGLPNGQPIGTQNQLWVVERTGGTPTCRTTGCQFMVGGGLQADMILRMLMRVPRILLSLDGEAAFVPVQDGGTGQIYRVGLRGTISFGAMLNGDRSCLPVALSHDKLLYAVSTLHEPEQLLTSDLEGGNEEVLLSLNQSLVSGWDQPRIERMLFAGSDGQAVEGWTILPDHGSAPYPAVLYIHGGPHGAWGHIFHFDFRLLTSAGYAVIIINHRASTGYGDAFATQIKGDWGNLDYTDLMTGVDYAIGQGWVDGDRMGVCGLSGGGNLSCWIVGQTDRFKAAVPENPVTNWVSFYGVSDIGPWFAVEQLGGHPHEIPEVYARCSPITYAHRCKTPTLLIQGEADWRCPPEQSEQFYAVLKVNGCPVEMVRLPASSHGGSIIGSVAVRRAQNAALLEWMNRYVLGL